MKLLALLLLVIQRESLCGEVANVHEPCSKDENDTMLYCDSRDGFTCRDGKCQCLQQYYLNYTTGKCEDQLDYINAHNLDEYRVKPGLYCLMDSHCIEGLECNDFKCACPKQCVYMKEQEVCDCGQDTPVGPIVTGCLSGILIIFFWARVFQKTFQRFKRKRAARISAVSNTEYDPRPSYSLSPANPPLPQNDSLLKHQTTTQTSSSHCQDSEALPLASQATTVSNSPSFPSNTDAMHNTLSLSTLCSTDSYKLIKPNAEDPPPYSLSPASGTAPLLVNSTPYPDGSSKSSYSPSPSQSAMTGFTVSNDPSSPK